MTADATGMHPVTIRPETASDVDGIRAVIRAAFPTADEARLVDALRADPDAWLDGLSWVADSDGIIGHALLTRCHIGSTPALCLAPGTPVPSGRVRYAAAFGI